MSDREVCEHYKQGDCPECNSMYDRIVNDDMTAITALRARIEELERENEMLAIKHQSAHSELVAILEIANNPNGDHRASHVLDSVTVKRVKDICRSLQLNNKQIANMESNWMPPNIYLKRISDAQRAAYERALQLVENERNRVIHDPMFIGLGCYQREDECDRIEQIIRAEMEKGGTE